MLWLKLVKKTNLFLFSCTEVWWCWFCCWQWPRSSLYLYTPMDTPR